MSSAFSRASARRAIVGSTALALCGLGLAAAPQADAAGQHTAIANTVPRWLGHAQQQATPAAASAARHEVRVYLAPQGGLDAVKAKVAALSDPQSPQYHQWLTTAQYDRQFAPTAAQADQVSSYLRSQGLTVTGVGTGRRYVTATGTARQLGAAFGTSIATFRHDGQTVTANTSAVSLPSSVAGAVLTVTGLDSTVAKKTPDHVVPGANAAADAANATNLAPNVKPPAGFVNARPCAINFGTPLATYQADFKTPLPQFMGKTLPYAVCGYTGPSYRAAYEGGSTLDGAGVTVAITDAYAWQKMAKDANTYAVNHGDGAYAPGQYTESLPTDFTHQAACGPSGWSGEESLDVEAVHAMAPAAKIRYYGSSSCFDSDFADTLARVVDENKAQLVTNSWSDVEANESASSIATYEQVFLQGATQGITFLFSSGDSGDELASTGIKQVGYPSSDPYVLGAGGTSTGIANGTVVSQTGWGTEKYTLSADGKSWNPVGFVYGAGGGYSALFNRPTYQDGVVSSSNRAVPDIAMDADPTTGMLVGQTQSFPDGVHYGEYRIGGTSLASPLLAGMMALAVQSSGSGLGWANPTLYKLQSTAFTDVTPKTANGVKGAVRVDYANGFDASKGLLYTVRTFDQDSTLFTARGWDDVTGLGVPNPALFAAVK
ncbi:S53 family peptidase [Lapillicoccus jejuensis]|uniref:Physarolisin II n=1 Tax=Lapillicoccus jejuensis TaxID=402171 RepID=A0A542DWU9_9MICO|nr:S53 family peptidase [Lapillicoccus jejuensis]TQJ07571.1 physarolisin II [Lapillicoccus jejuensis]